MLNTPRLSSYDDELKNNLLNLLGPQQLEVNEDVGRYLEAIEKKFPISHGRIDWPRTLNSIYKKSDPDSLANDFTFFIDQMKKDNPRIWELLLGMNCILFADGNVTMLNLYTVTVGKEKQYYVNPVCDTTLKSIEKYNSDPWTEIEIHPDTLKVNNGDLICYGEGRMGSEGFVALQDNKGRLKWAFFSTELNPFIKVVSKDQNTILAYSTYDLVVSINITAPETMKISNSIGWGSR